MSGVRGVVSVGRGPPRAGGHSCGAGAPRGLRAEDASCCSVLLSSGGTRGAAPLRGVLCGPGRCPQGKEERGRWLCRSVTPSRGDEGLCRPAVNLGALSCWMLSVQIPGAVAVPEVRARFRLVGRRTLLRTAAQPRDQTSENPRGRELDGKPGATGSAACAAPLAPRVGLPTCVRGRGRLTGALSARGREWEACECGGGVLASTASSAGRVSGEGAALPLAPQWRSTSPCCTR